VLELGVVHDDPVADRGVGADEAVAEPAPGADDGGAADRAPLQPAAGADRHGALERGLEQLAAHVALQRAQDQPVRLQHVLELAGVLPPAGDDVRLDVQAAVDHVLDRVGDLELAARAGHDRLHALEDGRREEIHADKGEVAARLRRLLDQPRHAAVAVQLGDAVALRVGHLLQQDQSVRTVGVEGLDEGRDALLQQVVAQVHDERVVAEVGLADEDRVGEAERRLLGQVRDHETEPAAVADRRLDLRPGVADDDADLDDAGGAHGIECVEEHRLVGHRDQLLGGGMRDGPQPRPGPAAEDQAFHAHTPVAAVR